MPRIRKLFTHAEGLFEFWPTTGPIVRRNRKLRKPTSVADPVPSFFNPQSERFFRLGELSQNRTTMDASASLSHAFTTSNGIFNYTYSRTTGQAFWTPYQHTYASAFESRTPFGRTITTPTQTSHPPHGQLKRHLSCRAVRAALSRQKHEPRV